MKTIKIDLIFTFENRSQEWFTADIDVTALDNKEQLFKAVAEQLSDEEKQDLVKISCCLMGKNVVAPDWYMDINGKFWDNEIPQLLKEIFNIDSTITPINV